METQAQKSQLTDGQRITELLDTVLPLFNRVSVLQAKLTPNGEDQKPLGPVFIASFSTTGYSFYVNREVEKEDGTKPFEWVQYTIGRIFETGHVGYAMGTLDREQITAHSPKQTIHVLAWLRDLLRECLPKGPNTK